MQGVLFQNQKLLSFFAWSGNTEKLKIFYKVNIQIEKEIRAHFLNTSNIQSPEKMSYLEHVCFYILFHIGLVDQNLQSLKNSPKTPLGSTVCPNTKSPLNSTFNLPSPTYFQK